MKNPFTQCTTSALAHRTVFQASAVHIALVFCVAAFCHASSAQTFPQKPIRVITGAAIGGQSDLAIRLMGAELGPRLGQAVIIENRPGAALTIGANAAAKSPADGYWLYFGGITTHPMFVKNNAVDPSKQFDPVSSSVRGLYFLYSSAKLPVNTFQALVEYSKANPGKLNLGTSARTIDLLMSMLKSRTAIDYTVIPYKGADQTVTALITGEVGVTLGSAGPLLRSHVATGTVKVLLALSEKPSVLMPGVPSAGDLGISNFDSSYSVGLWAPVGTPKDIIRKISTEAVAVTRLPALGEEFRTKLGFEPLGTSPEEQMRIFESEMRFWSEVARLTGFQPQ